MMPPALHTKLKLNSRLLPILAAVLLVMQITFPYKGWLILLVGLGGMWGVSYLWARSLARSLKFKREVRFGWAHVGDRLEERFTLTNTGFIPAIWVEVIDQTTMPNYSAGRVTGVGGASENRWQTEGICTQRGIFSLGPTRLQTGDPFGLYTVTLRHPDSATLTVTPPIVPLPSIEVAPGGRAGEGRPRPNTFERTVSAAGVRDYLPGDSLHTIHWPTTARRQSLYVRLFDSLPSGDWWIFVDLERRIQVGEGFSSTEEHSVILAASLADRGLRLGRSVGLVTHGQELVWLPPQSGDGQRHRILSALALAQPGPRTLTELLTHAQPAAPHISSLIVITVATEDHTWLEALLPLMQQGAIPTILLLDPASFGAPVGAPTTFPGSQALLANLGVAHYLITRDLLDQAEMRPGQQGRWEWRISPTGRAVPVQRPRNETWQSLA